MRNKAYTTRKQRNSKLVKVVGGLVVKDGKVLIGKRKNDDKFAGFWEFPGGKVEKGEKLAESLQREMKEELGIKVNVKPSFMKEEVMYKNKRYMFSFHECTLVGGKPVAKEVAEFKWELPSKLLNYKFPPVNNKVIRYMMHSQKVLF